EAVCFLVANGPGLRPLIFRGKSFESSGGDSEGVHKRRAGLNTGQSYHDVYELSKDIGVTSKVTAGDENAGSGFPAVRVADAAGVLKTVEVTVQSEEHKEDRSEASSSHSSLWIQNH